LPLQSCSKGADLLPRERHYHGLFRLNLKQSEGFRVTLRGRNSQNEIDGALIILGAMIIAPASWGKAPLGNLGVLLNGW
jgi:hypothetical protein